MSTVATDAAQAHMHERIILLIPSRGRPADAEDAAMSAVHNAHLAETIVRVVIDEDDEMLDAYANLGQDIDIYEVLPSGRRGIVDPLNESGLVAAIEAHYVGFMGDDHRVRTPGWDRLVLNHAPASVIYGDDLHHHDWLPTAAFVNSDVINKIGYMAPPALKHLYVDNFWKDLGAALGDIVYDPSMVIEHMHPDIVVAGKPKGQWDDLKRHLNSPEVYEADRLAYENYIATGGLVQDVEKVKNG